MAINYCKPVSKSGNIIPLNPFQYSGNANWYWFQTPYTLNGSPIQNEDHVNVIESSYQCEMQTCDELYPNGVATTGYDAIAGTTFTPINGIWWWKKQQCGANGTDRCYGYPNPAVLILPVKSISPIVGVFIVLNVVEYFSV